MIQLNIGCGSTITLGWKNYDNSPSVWLSSYMIFVNVLIRFRLLNKSQIEYIKFCSENNVLFCNAIKKNPRKREFCLNHLLLTYVRTF